MPRTDSSESSQISIHHSGHLTKVIVQMYVSGIASSCGVPKRLPSLPGHHADSTESSKISAGSFDDPASVILNFPLKILHSLTVHRSGRPR